MERRIVPFRRWHYTWLAQREAAEGATFVEPSVFSVIEQEYSRTWVVDGDPVACAWMLQMWPGRYSAGAYIARGTLKHMGWITPTARELIAAKPGRVEFTVRADFPAGHRWARQLGFQVETPLLKAYGPQGEDHVGYSRFN